jgi:hypothetical protein
LRALKLVKRQLAPLQTVVLKHDQRSCTAIPEKKRYRLVSFAR